MSSHAPQGAAGCGPDWVCRAMGGQDELRDLGAVTDVDVTKLLNSEREIHTALTANILRRCTLNSLFLD
jgi:hypothetical protein